MAISLASLLTAVRQRANIEGSSRVTDQELTAYVNASAGELYDIIVSRYEDYNLSSLQFTIAANQDGYILPAAVYKIRGLDRDDSGSGNWCAVHKFNWQDRNATGLAYRVQGNAIQIAPSSAAQGTYRLWYIPQLVDLQDGYNTTLDLNLSISHWEEYVILDAAIKVKNKEDSDPTILLAQKAAMKDRIESMASNRDAGESEKVGNVYDRAQEDEDYRLWRI